jgi:hypothetical protein
MSHWGYWDWIAYTALFIAAVILAADTGFKSAPRVMDRLPKLFRSGWWGFAPLVLVVVSTIILLGREYGYLNNNKVEQNISSVNANLLQPPSKRITNQTFRNQTISLDDYEYVNCIFENVTWVYEGHSLISVINPQIVSGSRLIFASHSPSIQQAILVLGGLVKRATGSEGASWILDVTPDRKE